MQLGLDTFLRHLWYLGAVGPARLVNLWPVCDTKQGNQLGTTRVKNDMTCVTVAQRRTACARKTSAALRTTRSALAVTAVIGFSVPADAQFFWQRQDNSDYVRRPSAEPRRPRVVRVKHRKPAEPAKETTKPQGPVIIAISIEKQKLKIYDENGLFAESPVSTGMRGHSTPMGVFSVIGKEKFHRSNIYSGAPMPYMQRITWSGIAMHAGVLPGYPASHGCIRMPMNFAVRMYGWTKYGARVIIAPGELSPSDFSHSLLVARKPDPAPVAVASASDTALASTPKSDKAKLDASANAKAVQSEADKLELRPSQPANSGEQVRTADASGAVPQKVNDGAAKGAAAASDPKMDKDQARQPEGDKPATVASASSGDGKTEDAKSEAAKLPASKPDAGKSEKAAVPPKPRTGHIAAYVSRKEGKLFVRQNFEPLFNVPVEIADRDRPLGTHVFTMRADKDNPQAYRWSVVSLPVRNQPDAEPRRKQRTEPVAQAPAVPPSSASEALDRVKIPDDAMQKIAEAIAPGGSITISDQGLGGETGLGTDFIVPLR